jgi:hypothetical protein
MSIVDVLRLEFAGILARLHGERSLSLQLMAEQVLGQLNGLADVAGGYAAVNDFYAEADGSMTIVFSMDGKLYRAPVTMSGTTAIMGAITEVEPMFAPVRSIEIVRQADGKLRWIAVAAASVLNRSGAIDSRALFDSFLANVTAHGYPQLRFYHDARLVLGVVDWMMRADNLFLSSGTMDGGDLATAFVDACEQRRGVWGCSIGFMPAHGPQMVEVANGLSIPVYAEGVLTEISVLPENAAASWFTSIGLEVTRSMDEAKKKALALLLGDEERAAAFIATVDSTNRAIAEQGLVTRAEAVKPLEVEVKVDAELQESLDKLGGLADRVTAIEERHATTEAEKAQKATAEEKAQAEAELASRILAGVTERLDKLEAAIAKLTGVEQERTQERTDLGKRLALVETFVTQWQDRRAADMPAARTLSATYRPREQAATPPGAFSTEAAAQATLSALKPK